MYQNLERIVIQSESEESRVHTVDVTEILRYAQDDI